MSEIDEDGIKQWSLTFSDLISAKLKSNIGLKDFDSEEVVFSEFLESINEPQWVVLCDDASTQQSILIIISYSSIVAMTNNFFSSSAMVEGDEKKALTFTEQFIANEISDDMVEAFKSNEFSMRLIRVESDLSLIRPFHDDDSLTVFKFNCSINNSPFGALKICHSHVL